MTTQVSDCTGVGTPNPRVVRGWVSCVRMFILCTWDALVKRKTKNN